jgi:ubiquitin C-terminal hydrolase
VTRALGLLTAAERLDGQNKYRCSGCKKLQAASKRLHLLVSFGFRVFTVWDFLRFKGSWLQNVFRVLGLSEFYGFSGFRVLRI